MIYIIGSLANPQVEEVADRLRGAGLDAFDQWKAAGPEADKWWYEYAKRRGWRYLDALRSAFVETAFNFDMEHLRKATAVVLVNPCGKSGHLELGWALGQGKPGYVLFDGEPERPDLMYKMATRIFFNVEDLINELKSCPVDTQSPRSGESPEHQPAQEPDQDYWVCDDPNHHSSTSWPCPNCQRITRNP